MLIDPVHSKQELKLYAVFALLATVLSGAIFLYYMAPTVTLAYSGEVVTAAFTFGVPHPTGYPVWTFLGFVWSHLILPFGNPAWRIGMLSVVMGASLVGVMTFMMTRAIRLLLRSLPLSQALEERLQHWISLTVGVSTALLFGFNRSVWFEACVPDMHLLTVLFFVLTTGTFLAWTIHPGRRGFLYATALLFGLGLTEHRSFALMLIPLGIGTLAVGIERFAATRKTAQDDGRIFRTFMTSLAPFWELAAAGLLWGAIILIGLAWLMDAKLSNMLSEYYFSNIRWQLAFCAVGSALLIAVGRLTGWWMARRIVALAGLVLAGAAFYLYLPVAAATNPPMNWGYAATKINFRHMLIGGCYQPWWDMMFNESVWPKFKAFALTLAGQYSLELTLVALATLLVMAFCWLWMKPQGRVLLAFVLVAFLTTSVERAAFYYPLISRQGEEMLSEWFGPAHAFYAMLIGLGIATLLGLVAGRGPKGSGFTVRLICVGLLALPLVSFTRNWSTCALHGNDFGYQFGRLMFAPGNGYPPMEKDSILFGGTDAGRFVSTYMIFCESRVAPENKFQDKQFDRSDVFIISQNCLADNTYMQGLRDQYDVSRPSNDSFYQRLLGRNHAYPREPITLPSPAEVNKAFQDYVEGVRSGKIPTGEKVKVSNGRVTVQGVNGVMQINGIVARYIFEHNKDQHAFYVEESYVIDWMYPYLRPAGIIMKLEKEPLPSPQDDPQLWQGIVARDRAFWDKLTGELLAREDFSRNYEAKNSFSKLRCALAGLYVSRDMPDAAEYAFKQALLLYPDSTEANFRLADFYCRMRRYPEARTLIKIYQKTDPNSIHVGSFLDRIQALEDQQKERRGSK